MPSTKNREFLDEEHVIVNRPRPSRKNTLPLVVEFDQWCEDNLDHLINVYETIQEMSQKTGRLVFDRETTSFQHFCKIAYDHSFKYTRSDSNYKDEDEDEDEDEDDTIVF